MARKTQELESEKPDRRNEAGRPAVDLTPVSGAIDSLSRQFATAIETLDAENQADNRERRNYEANEFWWTRVAAIAGIGFSVFSLLLSGLTLWVLGSTLGVYRGQATIMSTQADIMDKQRQIAEQQNANLTRQLDDFEKQNRAYLVVIGLTDDLPNTKDADRKGERYILKNVGPTVASEISIESGGGAGRDHPMDAPLQQAPSPHKNGLSLGPGMEISLNGGRMGHYDPNDEIMKLILAGVGHWSRFVAIGYRDIYGQAHSVQDTICYQAYSKSYVPCFHSDDQK